VAHYSILKLLGWVAVSGVMAAAAAWITLGGAGSGSYLTLALGGAGLLFFGGIAASHALRLFDRRPQVVIDQSGLFVRAHGEKRIGLRAIKRVSTDTLGQIGLTLHSPAKYPIETRRRRLIYRINGSAARGFFGDVWIRTNVLDRSKDAVLDAIASHRPKTDFERQLDALSAAG